MVSGTHERFGQNWWPTVCPERRYSEEQLRGKVKQAGGPVQLVNHSVDGDAAEYPKIFGRLRRSYLAS